MTIKPIDLQTNMNQMSEVGKTEHTRLNSLTDQQLLMDKQAADKSNLVNTRLDESEKAEKTAIRDENKKHDKQSASGHGEGREKKEAPRPRDRMKDERMGKIIDVLK